jgi:hypothetical protein
LATLEGKYVSNKRAPSNYTQAVVMNTLLKSLKLNELKLTQLRSKKRVFVSVVKDLKELKDWFSNRFEFFFCLHNFDGG